MRQSLAFAFVTALLVSGTVTTPCDAQGTQFGVYLGSSLSRFQENSTIIADEDLVSNKRRVALQIGLWMQRPLSSMLSVQPELHYVRKGAKFSFDDTSEDFSADITFGLNYIEVPVLLRLNLGSDGSAVRPFLLAGPAFGYNVNCTTKVEATGFDGSSDCDEEGDIDLRTFDVGATIGGGFAFSAAGRSFTLGARLTQGLRTIASDAEAPKNQNISVLLGIGF